GSRGAPADGRRAGGARKQLAGIWRRRYSPRDRRETGGNYDGREERARPTRLVVKPKRVLVGRTADPRGSDSAGWRCGHKGFVAASVLNRHLYRSCILGGPG